MRVSFCSALLALAAAVAITATPVSAAAQSGVDIIRGRVTGPDKRPIANADVSAQSMTDETIREGRTNNDGRFTILFGGGDGDYMITVRALGMLPKSFEVQKVNDDDAVILANAAMEAAPEQLNTVTVNGNRQRPIAGDNSPDIGGAEQNFNTAGIPLEAMGDLAAMAAYLPGVSAISNADGTNGFSVLGLSSDQNSILLNGLTFGGTLPRDVSVSARLSTTSFDASSGGFSGGQISSRTLGGSNYKTRNLHVTFDNPTLQWADPTTRSLGQQYSNVIASGSLSGPIIWNKLFYNTSFQLGQRSSDLQTLLNTDPNALERVGISQDSVAQLLAYMQAAGIPTTVSAVPSNRLADQGALFGQFGFSPTGTETWGLLLNGSWNKSGGASLSTSAVPAHGGQNTRTAGTVQLSHAGYYGFGILNETSVSASVSDNGSDAYLLLPDARVLVTSDFDDGTSGVSTLQFGGNSSYPSSSTNYQWQLSNATSWFTDDNSHRIKLTEDLQVSRFLTDRNANSRGTFYYNSLSDLLNDTPASFTRRLVPADRSGDVGTLALSLGDAWRPQNRLQVEYGVRVEGSHFNTAPQLNPLVQSTFGVPNNTVPDEIAVSPRLGFSWQVGNMPEIEGFRGAFHRPRYVISGGVGAFRNNPQATLISNAVDQTGLPSAAQQISCSGTATPIPNWGLYAADPDSIPTQCADGSLGTVFSSSAPSVALFSPDYRTQRSWRANLGISGLLTPLFNANLQFTLSRNLDQHGTLDLNFDDTQRFTLANEGGRPVFVDPSSIVPTTGAIAAGAGRLDTNFSQVTESVSDLRSLTQQVQFTLSPRSFNSAYRWSFAYVFRETHELDRGFGDNTAGDPLALFWSNSGPSHEFDLSGSVTIKGAVNLTTSLRLSSGSRFTPTVSGDINGDGYSNDRAFIFDPATTADTAVRDGMQALLNGLSGSSRACLADQLGEIAGRNSCMGPWSLSLQAISIQLVSDRVHLPSRLTVGMQLANPLTGVDALVHGGDNLHGWGQRPIVDPTLLYVRGFDPATDEFQYEVNPRFGNSAIAQTAAYAPFSATLDVRVAVGPDRNLQQLEQLLRGSNRGGGGGGRGGFGGRGGGRGGANGNNAASGRPSELAIKNRYVRGYPNPMDQMLRQRDTLKLTETQTDSLIAMNKAFANSVDSIWTPIAHYLAQLPDKFDVNEAYDHVKVGQNATIDLLVAYAPRVKGLLTSDQLLKLPTFLAAFLDPATLREIRPGRAFGFGGGSVGGGGGGGFGGGGRGGRGG